MQFVNCNLCGSRDQVLLDRHRKDRYLSPEVEIRMVICKNCGLVYANPQLEENDLRHIYSTDYGGSRQDLPGEGYLHSNEVYFESKLKWLEERLTFNDGIKKSLDIGCDAGVFPSLFQKRGWDAYGLEPTVHYAEFARQEYGVKVTTGFLEDVQFPESYFDMVTLHRVLELMRNPTQALFIIRNLLKPKGYIYIAMPHVLKRSKLPYFGGAYMFMFSPNTLGLTLRKTGFNPICIEKGRMIHAIAQKGDLPPNIDFSTEGDDYRKVIKTVRSNKIRLFLKQGSRNIMMSIVVRALGEANKRKIMQLIRKLLR